MVLPLASLHAEVRPRRHVGQRRELPEQLALLARELLGHGDLEADQQVAGVLAASAGDPSAPDPEGAAVLGAGRHLEGDRAVEGRHLQVGAEGGLGEGHRHGDGQVLAVAAEQRVRGDVDLDDQVAGWRAGLARLALALEPDGGAVADPDRDAHAQLAGADLAAPALAGRAGVAGDRAAAVAGRAGAGQGARLGAGAVTGVAGSRAAELQRDGGAAHGLLEAEGDLALDVAAAAGGRLAAATPEQVAEQVPEAAEVLDPDPGATGEAAREATAGEATTERARAEQPAGLVVLRALLEVGEHAVGPADLLEALLGRLVARVGVRVELLGELPVGLLDVGGRGVLGHAEDLVEVLLQILRVVHLATSRPSPSPGGAPCPAARTLSARRRPPCPAPPPPARRRPPPRAARGRTACPRPRS